MIKLIIVLLFIQLDFFNKKSVVVPISQYITVLSPSSTSLIDSTKNGKMVVFNPLCLNKQRVVVSKNHSSSASYNISHKTAAVLTFSESFDAYNLRSI
jgi:hypothetical protein